MRKTLAFALALLGLFDSIYLLWMYLSPAIPMVCLGGGCDAIRASRYAHLFGIPTPAYGVAMYLVLAVLMFSETLSPRAGWTRRAVLAIAAAGVVVSGWLTYIEGSVVHAWCAWCVTQAVAVTIIFVLYATVQGQEYARTGFRSTPARREWNVLMVSIIVGSAAFYFLQRSELKHVEAPPPPAAQTLAARVIRPESHVDGNPDSPVTFVEFGDLQCPACVASYPEIRALRAQFGDRVRFVFRQFPFPSLHPFAMKAAEAAECAAQQGRFWQYVDRAYDANGNLPVPALESFAAELGLDKNAFHQCLSTDATLPVVQRDQGDGLALGVRATPTYFVGERKIEGPLPFDQFAAMLKDDLAKAGPKPAPAQAASAAHAGNTDAPAKPAAKNTKNAAAKSAAGGSLLSMSGTGTGTDGGFLTIKGASTDCSEDAAKLPPPPVIHTNDAEQKLRQGALFVDVRSPEAFETGHIKGAVNVPLLDVERRAGELPKEKSLVIYEAGTAGGDVCAAAKSAARVLISRGYKAVVYQEGFKDWEKAGAPIER